MEDPKIVLRLWLIDASHITHGDPRYGDPRRLMLCIYTYLRIYPCGCQPKTRWQVFPPDFIPFQLVSRNMLQKTSENIPYFQKIYEDLWRSTWSSMKQIFFPELPWPSQPSTISTSSTAFEDARTRHRRTAEDAARSQRSIAPILSRHPGAVRSHWLHQYLGRGCWHHQNYQRLLKWPDFGTWITYDNVAFVPIARNDCYSLLI